MASLLNTGLNLFGSYETSPSSKNRRIFGFCPSLGSPRIEEPRTKYFLDLSIDFIGKSLLLSDQKCIRQRSTKAPGNFSVNAQASVSVSRALRWWEKALKPNMLEIHSAQELVDSLLDADDRLVVVDFYSPGCGGCKALHPKICQLAESNQNAIFLKVNYEDLKTLCQALHVRVLPFFRLYRGPEGRLCSFSCTNATIKKFKDALAKYGENRLNVGPAKGLDESEILKLASVGELPADFAPAAAEERKVENLIIGNLDLHDSWSKTGHTMDLKQETAILYHQLHH